MAPILGDLGLAATEPLLQNYRFSAVSVVWHGPCNVVGNHNANSFSGGTAMNIRNIQRHIVSAAAALVVSAFIVGAAVGPAAVQTASAPVQPSVA
jgi:hypothetical protein